MASFSTPRDPPVATIRGVSSVRDISWQEGSGNITVTTDSRVYEHKFYYAMFMIILYFRYSCTLWRHVLM